MQKRGFTLAEVLITLGIVGVVAALTAPALVMSSRNEANAAKLSVVVSNLENAFQSAIAQQGADNLYGTDMWADERTNANEGDKAAFVGKLGQYMIVNGYSDSDAQYYGTVRTCAMSESGGTNGDACNASANSARFGGDGDMFTIETKNGAAIHIRTYRHTNAEIDAGKTAAIADGGSYYTNAADINIDVNGKNPPNTYGRDIFWFEVGENGILYPVGSRDVARLEPEQGRWDQNLRAACNDTSKGSDVALRGMGCTARIIADGYKMNY